MVVLFTMAEECSSRFAQVSNEEVENCLRVSVPSNTRKMTALWLKVLSDYLFERQIKVDLKTCSEEELASVLVRLYTEVRTKQKPSISPRLFGQCTLNISLPPFTKG